MKRTAAMCALALGVVACGDGNPFDVDEPGEDTDPGSAYLTDQGTFLTLNNVSYDPDSDTLTLNNIPFDDPNNAYERITTEAFTNGFDAYQSAPEAGTNEFQYFAIFRRSDSGQSQVASVGTTRYIDFGYGGSGAQRLGSDPNLPTSGIFSYNGEYGAVRTTLDAGTNGENVLEYVTGEATLRVDFDDFDDTGAIGGSIDNRILYDETGAQIGTLAGFISLQDTDIDFTNGSIEVAGATEFDDDRVQTNSGNWTGVFAGPNGEEIAGILVVEDDTVREVGGFIATTE